MKFSSMIKRMLAAPLRALMVLSTLSVLSGCAGLVSLEPPDVSLADLKVTSMTALEQRFAAALRIQNPNDESLVFDGMVVNIALNGRKLARGLSSERVEVPRLGEAYYPVNLSTGPLEWLAQLQALSRGSTDMNYEITGNTWLVRGTGKHKLPFSHEGAIDLNLGAAR